LDLAIFLSADAFINESLQLRLFLLLYKGTVLQKLFDGPRLSLVQGRVEETTGASATTGLVDPASVLVSLDERVLGVAEFLDELFEKHVCALIHTGLDLASLASFVLGMRFVMRESMHFLLRVGSKFLP
jgi:hypothetical protein